MNTRAATQTAAKNGQRELIAALIAMLVGAPLCFVFARAMADGELRRREAPLRAMLGDSGFESLSRGEKTDLNYLGDGLLAPDFELRDQNGKPWHLKDHRGKLIVMNFWTVTCQPCVEEMPSLVTLADIVAHRDDIEVVAVSTDKSWEGVRAIFPPRSHLNVLFDPKSEIVRGKYGTRLFPETWVIDKGGVIRMRIDGGRDWASALTIDALERFL